MKFSRRLAALAALLPLCAMFTGAEEKSLNPKIVKIVDEVSEARIRATIEKLVSFGTRNTMSNADDPARGVGAARQWVFNEFQSYSPRLQVRFDKYRVKKQGQRIFKDVDLWNVVAVLPGTKMPETQVFVSGHYDSLNMGTRPAGAAAGPGTEAAPAPVGERPQLTPADFEKSANLTAPGACDDGSGTAAVMELARVMSQYEFDKTLVFVAFAGEEQGLIGSTLLAAKAKKENQVIEAVLNNDIIGTDRSGDGKMSNTSVSVYSDESMDSLPQQLSRYAKEVGERYLPAFKVETVFMQDRLGRGGDHTPFQLEGFAAVRISTPNEIYANQHHDTDLLENMSVPYTAKVAKFNAAVAASLALAPKPPVIMRAPGQFGGRNGGRAGASEQAGNTGGGRRGGAPAADGAAPAGRGPAAGAAGRRPTPMISRGASGYDAVLQWRAAGPDADIKGYAVVMRSTEAANWQQEFYVGKVTQFTLKDVSIDDVKLGVKAIGNDGSESLVTAYVYPPRTKTEIETVEDK
jgi:Peptidase family M28